MATGDVRWRQQEREWYSINLKLVKPAESIHDGEIEARALMDGEFDDDMVVESTGLYKNLRGMSMTMLDLRPGTYILIASTYEPDQENSFFISSSSSKPVSIWGLP